MIQGLMMGRIGLIRRIGHWQFASPIRRIGPLRPMKCVPASIDQFWMPSSELSCVEETLDRPPSRGSMENMIPGLFLLAS